jgi:catalase
MASENGENGDSRLTTNFGVPVGDNQNSRTAGTHGPATLEDVHLIEKLAHFDRERVPERVVHAKGGGAFGYFEVTNDVTEFTKADFLSKLANVRKCLRAFRRLPVNSGLLTPYATRAVLR